MPNRQAAPPRYVFKLYVLGHTDSARSAIEAMRQACAKHLGGRCRINTIDVLEHPELADRDQIFATPTVIKESPGPARRAIGDLSDATKVLRSLGILEDSG
jgi:circadian clock protein KaiB